MSRASCDLVCRPGTPNRSRTRRRQRVRPHFDWQRGLTLVRGRDYDSNRLVDRPSQPAYPACRRPRRRDRHLSGRGAHATPPSRSAGSLRIRREAPRELYLKLEVLQPIGSFKIRGAYNVVRQLTPEQLKRGRVDRQRGKCRAGRGLRRPAGRRPMLGDGDGYRARHQDSRDRTARCAHRASQLRRMLADGRGTWLRSHDRLLRASVRRRSVHRGKRNGGARNSRGPARRGCDRRAARRRRAAVGPRGGGRRAEARHPGVRGRTRDGCAAGGIAGGRTSGLLRRLETSFVDGAGGKSVLETMWPLLAPLAGSIVVSLDETARAMQLVAERAHVIAEGAAGCAVAAALSGRAGSGKIVAVVSGGNIDLVRFATLIGAYAESQMKRYLEPSRSSRSHLQTRRARDRSLVELACRGARGVPPPRLRVVACDRAQSGTHAGADPAGQARGRCGGPGLPPAVRTRRSRRSTTPGWPGTPGGWRGFPSTPARSSPTSRPSSRCINRCRSTPAALACWPAITARKRRDLGVPLIGVGFMYPQGYFHQRISADGWQEESYEHLNWTDAPIEPATTRDGRPCVTAVPLGDRSVLVAVWRVRMGRVKLYLLDTDLEENAPWDRELSARLYGGDRETRIQQEILLGIGGVRALKALGVGSGGVSPQRGPRRVRRAAAHSRPDRARIDVRSGAWKRSARPPCSRPTRRCRPATTRFRFSWSRSTWPAAGERSARIATSSWRSGRTTLAAGRSST